MKKILVCSILLLTSLIAFCAPVGTWKNYLSYHTTTEIEHVGDIYYVLASGGLYSYNAKDGSIYTYDKTNGLSDTGIKAIQWNKSSRKLVIVYKDNNIDLLSENGKIENLPDYYLKAMTEDKTIHSIYNNGVFAYLSTAFGILKVNTKNAEFSDTYFLNESVEYAYIANNQLYAAIPTKGLMACSLASNPQNKSNWSVVGAYVAPNKQLNATDLAVINKVKPNGAQYNSFAFMTLKGNTLYTAPGGFNSVIDASTPGAVQVYDGQKWTMYEDDLTTKTPNIPYMSITSVAVDPKDAQHVFASGRTGLYEFRDGKFVKHYTYTNSPLKAFKPNNPNYVITLSISFDSQGNLYVLNGNNPDGTSLLRLNSNGSWDDLHQDALVANGYSFRILTNLTWDSRNLLWFVNDHWDNKSLAYFNPKTNQLKLYSTFYNQDGVALGDGRVHCVAEDKQQNMWIGTGNGPVMLTPSQIRSGSENFNQIKVPRNDGTNFADYLLSGVDITCIVVDGANRKWFGTNGNGVYLISADNLQELKHFTAENSPLLSNTIESMAINNNTGEVFFGTTEGLCSYVTDATDAPSTSSDSDVLVYPNPVLPDYTGLITIKGLAFDSHVKIVTTNGALVAEGRSNGGSFTWDGNDQNGQRVAGGMYIVLSATAEGESSVVTKIAIIR